MILLGIICSLQFYLSCQYPVHTDYENMGEVNIHNETYKFLRPTIHVIKEEQEIRRNSKRPSRLWHHWSGVSGKRNYKYLLDLRKNLDVPIMSNYLYSLRKNLGTKYTKDTKGKYTNTEDNKGNEDTKDTEDTKDNKYTKYNKDTKGKNRTDMNTKDTKGRDIKKTQYTDTEDMPNHFYSLRKNLRTKDNNETAKNGTTNGTKGTTKTTKNGTEGTTKTTKNGTEGTTKTTKNGNEATTKTAKNGTEGTTETAKNGTKGTTETPKNGTKGTKETPKNGTEGTKEAPKNGTEGTIVFSMYCPFLGQLQFVRRYNTVTYEPIDWWKS